MSPLLRASARAFYVPAAVVSVVSGLALGAGSLPVGGCGGAAGQDVLDSKESTSSSGSSGASGSTSGGTSGSSGSTSGSSGSTSGAPDGSIDSSTACPPETEPNNNRDTANTLAPTRCGAITPNSESDFLAFTLKPSSTSMQITFTGQVVLKVDVNGNTITLGSGGGGIVPFVKGQRYVIEVKATDRANSVPWRVDLIEK